MRVIAGKLKGRTIKHKGELRPTEGKVREAVFNILPHELSGLTVLDLFAGTGALGIEAVSRGAQHAVFVEFGGGAASLIRENLESLGILDMCRVMQKKALPGLKLLAAEGETFDLVFMDPPYKSGLCEEVLQELPGLGVLDHEAVVVVEHAPHLELSEAYGKLSRFERRQYGQSVVSFYQAVGMKDEG